ncbi:MAG: hypothetical protein DMG36_04930 [Acidobacteria bacterium]|nr:MAG: hypothetical protein DMG36_04930 [Acidobacteriota bacterium]
MPYSMQSSLWKQRVKSLLRYRESFSKKRNEPAARASRKPFVRVAACSRIADLCPPAQATRQGSLQPYVCRVKSRPMIAAGTSTWVAFLEGDPGKDAQLLDKALADRQVVMVPVVLAELLSDPKLPASVAETLSDVPLVEIGTGYWQRAGALRAKVLAKRRKARLGDALIAQSCIDAHIPLLTRDRDFRAFAEAAGLKLGPEM